MAKNILVNEVFALKEHGEIAIKVTDGSTLKTIRMRDDDFRTAFPNGLYEGAHLTIREDENGNITSASPEIWFPVVQDRPNVPQEAEKKYDYHEEYA